jgi:two-component system chemotaxis sensor kinase CheA
MEADAVMSDTVIKEVFLNEARELLSNIESDMVLFEEGGDVDTLNRIFRCIHTLKGSSAMAGFENVSELAHAIESVLDMLRTGSIGINPRLTTLFLECLDWGKMVLFGACSDFDSNAAKKHLIERLQEHSSEEDETPREARFEETEGIGERYFRIRAKFRENIFESGIDPLSIIEDLISLGTAVELKADDTNLPDMDSLDPEKCYLAWDITLRSKCTREKIDEVFLFVSDDNEIDIEDVSALFTAEGLHGRYIEEKKIGEILVRKGIITRKELDEVLGEQEIKNRKIGDIIVEKGYATQHEIQSALGEQERIRLRVETETVRVDTKKLDSLMNLLGEIVIGQSALARIADGLPEEEGFMLKNALYGLDRTTREFQEQIMSIRMIPVGPTFQQFRRFVRDTARDLGKEIMLEIFGEETELDKTVIEKISDPLKHMIRNAIDHGIEGPDERERRGKPRQGRIRLNAYHQEGSVFIEVTDDGAGLDRNKIRERAVSLGLVKPGDEIPDVKLFSFIFMPGFTTSEEAGDLSGRGVGMDVVKTNIESLRGVVEISTAENAGTTFLIKLPLTLAIIEGMLLRSGGSVYIVPLLSIIECIQPEKEDIERFEGKGELVHFRGRYVPLVRLYDYFGTKADCENPWETIVVIVESGNDTIGIMVDELLGQQQIVIKTLSGNITKTRAVSGAAILGDGKVALILDIHGLCGEMARC